MRLLADVALESLTTSTGCLVEADARRHRAIVMVCWAAPSGSSTPESLALQPHTSRADRGVLLTGTTTRENSVKLSVKSASSDHPRTA
jgi:hypothetical protein